MTTPEIAKEIVIAMICNGAFTFYSASSENDLDTPALNAKAVAAAYETVYAGLVATNSKSR